MRSCASKNKFKLIAYTAFSLFVIALSTINAYFFYRLFVFQDESICPPNTLHSSVNLVQCFKKKVLLGFPEVRAKLNGTHNVISYNNIEEYNRKSQHGCYNVGSNDIINIHQDDGHIYYMTIHTIALFQELLLSENNPVVTPNVYTNEFQPCFCSIYYSNKIIHLINPTVNETSSSKGEVTESIIFANGEEWILKREIPQVMTIDYLEWTSLDKKSITVQKRDVYPFFVCQLQLGHAENLKDYVSKQYKIK